MTARSCDCCGTAARRLLVNAAGAVCQRCHDRYSMFSTLALYQTWRFLQTFSASRPAALHFSLSAFFAILAGFGIYTLFKPAAQIAVQAPAAAFLTIAIFFFWSQWLPRLHWALLLLRSSFAKRGSMPTKLAEFFAAGVRPIQHGCNAEVSQWVRESGLGLVLEDLTESGLQRAAEQVARHEPSPGEVARARERTRSHFGLEAGLSAYACILGQLLAKHNP